MSLYDDPFVRRLLDGTDNPDPNQTQQFVPNSVFPEQQQRIADNPALMDAPANTTVPEVAPTVQPQKINSILDLIRANEPVQDPTLDQRYKKAAMLDSLGQAFGNLAGAVGVGMGATVPRLSQDNNIARLYGMKEAEKQRYREQKHSWDAQMLQGAIQEMGMSAQARKDKEATDRWQKDYDLKVSDNKAKWAAATDKATSQEAKDKATADYREKDLAIKKFAAESGRINANKESAADKSNDPNKIVYSWQNPVTKEVKNYTAYELQNEFDAAKQNPANGDVKAIMANYQNNSVLGQKEIVTRALNNQAVEKAKQDDLTKRANFTLNLANQDKQPKVPLAPQPTKTKKANAGGLY